MVQWCTNSQLEQLTRSEFYLLNKGFREICIMYLRYRVYPCFGVHLIRICFCYRAFERKLSYDANHPIRIQNTLYHWCTLSLYAVQFTRHMNICLLIPFIMKNMIQIYLPLLCSQNFLLPFRICLPILPSFLIE